RASRSRDDCPSIPSPQGAGRCGPLYEREMPVHHSKRQRGWNPQVGIRAEGTNSELCDADSSWRGPCLPDGATVAVRPLHDRVLEEPRLVPGAPPGLTSSLLGSVRIVLTLWRMPM